MLGNYGRGAGLYAQPSVVSNAALQPSQRLKLWHAIADDRRGDAVETHGFEEEPPGHQSLDADAWGGRGLHAEPSVVSVAALQPSQWREGDGAAAERALGV